MKAALLTLGAAGMGWFGWEGGGMAADWLNLDELDLVLRVAGVFLLLTAAERALSAWSRHRTPSEGE